MKYLLLGVALAILTSAEAQKKKPGRPGNLPSRFLEKQWWIGLKAGTNLSEADPANRYTVITPLNYDASLLEKSYGRFNKTGSQAMLEVTFYVKGVSFSLQPGYRHSRFSYANRLDWFNTESAGERLELQYDHELRTDFADLPFLIKYEFTRTALRPYIHAGVYYSWLINATQSVTTRGIDQASGGINPFTSPAIRIGARDLYTNYWGLLGGVGFNYTVGNIRITFEATYQRGMSNMTNVQNRFGNDRLTGVGDVQDDLFQHNLLFSGGVLFPLRFLSNSYRSLDR